MRRFLGRIHQIIFAMTGVSPISPWRGLRGLPFFVRDFFRFARAQRKVGNFRIKLKDLYPVLTDYSDQAGVASGHYFHQDLWAARKIYEARPANHFDIGSRIDGFIAHLLPFMPVTVLDVRPLQSKIPGLKFIQQDATQLRDFTDQSIDSLSSLHAAEHFGLGRYGDPIAPEACFDAMRSMQRVLKPGGKLYFAVPIGRERLEFNAQRVFSPMTVISTFGELKLVSFSAVNDQGDLVSPARPEDFESARFSCGLFEFTK